MSSPATFGTFLNVINSSAAERSMPRLIFGMLKDIAKSGGERPLREITSAASAGGEELLSIVLEAKKNGLLEIEEQQGRSIVKVTSLGKAFVDR